MFRRHKRAGRRNREPKRRIQRRRGAIIGDDSSEPRDFCRFDSLKP
jgi:hypothetical protein